MNQNLTNATTYSVNSYQGSTTVTLPSGTNALIRPIQTVGYTGLQSMSGTSTIQSSSSNGILSSNANGSTLNIYDQLYSQLGGSSVLGSRDSSGIHYAQDYVPNYIQGIDYGQVNGNLLIGGNGTAITIGSPNFKYQKTYKLEDIDNLIKLLTLWVDDRELINKMEKMYKHWKAMEENQNK